MRTSPARSVLHAPIGPVVALLATLVLGLLAAPAAAQFDGGSFGQPATAGRPGADEAPKVTVSAIASSDRVPAGGTVVVAGALTHQPGWHSNLHEPVVPEEMDGFVPFKTDLTGEWPAGFEPGPIQWPEPHAVEVRFTGTPVEYLVYEGVAPIFVPVRVGADVEPGVYQIPLRVAYQACDDQICLIPTTETVSVSIEVVEAGTAIAGQSPDLFANFDEAVFDNAELWSDQPVVEPSADPATASDAIEAPPTDEGTSPAGSLLGISLGSGLIPLAILSFIGGAILNLTPCVLPMIPIKIMTLTSHSGESRARTLVLGLSMFIGVTAFWGALGIPAALAAGYADPSRVFGLWYVTAPLGLLIVLLALGMMGLFSITLPQSAYRFNPKPDSVPGSFLFGLLTAAFGLPCFGFVAGALIPAAITLGGPAVVTIFAALGLGMGAPYLVLSAFPKLVDRVPKTGPASELVKEVLGLIMAGFGLFFFGTGLRSLVKTHPYTSESLHIYALSLLILASGLWLVWQTFRITRSPVRRGVFGLVGLALAAAAVYTSVGSTQGHRADYLERQRALAEAGGVPGAILKTVWNDYTPATLERALGEGMVAFVDFTADWCINCKVFEAQVLDVEPTRSLLRSDSVAMLKVDLTGSNPDGEQLLSDLGRVGIPTWAVYGPGVEEPIIITDYTPGSVRRAIEAAGGGAVASARE